MDATDLSWIVSSIAVLIAFFSLWYGSLRGPAITLCEDPKFIMDIEIPKEEPKIIKNLITFYSDFIFVNSGARSGVVKLKINFQIAEELQDFFRTYLTREIIPREYDDAWSREKLDEKFIPITERECKIIKTGMKVYFYDWKNYVKLSPVNNKDEILTVLSQIDKQNKERLQKFHQVLKAGMHLGTISVDSEQTRTKWVVQTKNDKREIVPRMPIGEIPQEFVDYFGSCLKRWDNIRPIFPLDELIEIDHQMDNQLLYPLNANYTQLKNNMTEYDNYDVRLETGFLTSWKTLLGYEPRERLVDFLLVSTGLKSQLNNLITKSEEFNLDLDVFKQSEEASKQLQDSINKQIKDLIKEYQNVITELKSLQKILNDCRISMRN